MVYVEAEGTPLERVRLSADLARKFNATLLGISARATRPLMTGDGIVATVLLDASIPVFPAGHVAKDAPDRLGGCRGFDGIFVSPDLYVIHRVLPFSWL